jgi:hypothetical protein
MMYKSSQLCIFELEDPSLWWWTVLKVEHWGLRTPFFLL